MDERTSRLIEYTVEALLVAWLGYLFFYQNYLLYRWHRGLPLPSKTPFLIAGIFAGALLFWYEWSKFERDLEKRRRASLESGISTASKNPNSESSINSPEDAP